MTRRKFLGRVLGCMTAATLLAVLAPAAIAQTKLKIAAGQRGNWDSSVPEVAQRMGIARKHGVELEILYTQGAGETQQAVISGSVDIGIAAGVMGVLGAFSKGAPIRVIANESTGAQDLYWYVKADSPIKSWADTAGKTLAYSTTGSSTHGVVQAFMSEKKLTAKLVATGGPPSTLTQVMSGQIDAGWVTAPLPKEFAEGKVRILARGNDAPQLATITTRVHAFNANYAQKSPRAVKSFLRAYDEAVDAVYADPKVLARSSELLKVTPEQGRQILTEFFPRKALTIDKIGDLDASVAQAVANKTLKAALTDTQKAAIHKTVAEFNSK